ncbi:hypothetical protein Tco_1214351 [Tanacetum coccineum]
MTSASSKKLKTGDVEIDVEAPSHSVPQEIEATVEDVPRAQQTASSLKKVGTKKKLLGRKGIQPSDCEILLSCYMQLLTGRLMPYGLGSIKCILQTDNSPANKKSEGVGLVLWGDLQILMDSPKVNDGMDAGYTYVCGQEVSPLYKPYRKDARSSARDLSRNNVSCVQVKTQADWMLLSSSYFNPQVSTSGYIVPTGRVVVPTTGRMLVPAVKYYHISPGGYLVPTSIILSPGKVK